MLNTGVKQILGRNPALTTLHNAAAAIGNGAALGVGGFNGVTLEVAATASAFTAVPKIKFESGSAAFVGVSAFKLDGTKLAAITEAGLYWVPTFGAEQMIADLTAIADGTVAVKARPSYAPNAFAQTSAAGLGGGASEVTLEAARVLLASIDGTDFSTATKQDALIAKLAGGLPAGLGRLAAAAALGVALDNESKAVLDALKTALEGTLSTKRAGVVRRGETLSKSGTITGNTSTPTVETSILQPAAGKGYAIRGLYFNAAAHGSAGSHSIRLSFQAASGNLATVVDAAVPYNHDLRIRGMQAYGMNGSTPLAPTTAYPDVARWPELLLAVLITNARPLYVHYIDATNGSTGTTRAIEFDIEEFNI